MLSPQMDLDEIIVDDDQLKNEKWLWEVVKKSRSEEGDFVTATTAREISSPFGRNHPRPLPLHKQRLLVLTTSENPCCVHKHEQIPFPAHAEQWERLAVCVRSHWS